MEWLEAGFPSFHTTHKYSTVGQHHLQSIVKYLFSDVTPPSAQISATNFHDLTQITGGDNPKRTEKPKAHGFSVRFGLKHTLRQVIVTGRGVNRKHNPAERCDLRFGLQSARKN